MKKIDFLSLDGRSLRTFLTVLDELSVTRAAEHLEVTQSAVSHTLDKLRIAFGDPLFVRSGRHIAATEQANALRAPVQQVLDELKALTDTRLFDPTLGELDYVIAANDYQRDLIFPGLLKALYDEGVNLFARFIPSGLPAAELLRRDRCQFLITPFPPEGPDIFQVRLFEDRLVCFYDQKMRKAPKTLQEFLESDLVDVRFDDDQSSLSALDHAIKKRLRKPRVAVPNFNAVYPFLKNSKMLSVELSLMAKLAFRGLQYADLPFSPPSISVYLVWHRRHHTDPAHRWFRDRIQEYIGNTLVE
jgi:DNA-binding transcriptional LysR family regulator